MPKSFYLQALSRLSVHGAKCFCNCNPNSPYHWFYRDVLEHLEENDGLYLHFTMDDNLSLTEETKERYKKHFKGVFYDRNILGKWVVADGLIYTMFDKNKNIIPANQIQYENIVQWAIGVDYGTQNATVFLLIGKDYEGRLIVCKEYYYSGRAEAEKQGSQDVQKTDQEYTDDLRKFINDMYELTGKTYREVPIIIDPSAASFKLNVRRFHMRTKNADNEVMDGIRTVATLMGEQKLLVSDECRETITSIYSYVWDEKKQLKGIDAPLKNDTDHCCDALRYATMYFENKNLNANRAFNVGW
nr:MAG TPA: large terminase [Caudoviricetes sp.]